MRALRTRIYYYRFSYSQRDVYSNGYTIKAPKQDSYFGALKV